VNGTFTYYFRHRPYRKLTGFSEFAKYGTEKEKYFLISLVIVDQRQQTGEVLPELHLESASDPRYRLALRACHCVSTLRFFDPATPLVAAVDTRQYERTHHV